MRFDHTNDVSRNTHDYLKINKSTKVSNHAANNYNKHDREVDIVTVNNSNNLNSDNNIDNNRREISLKVENLSKIFDSPAGGVIALRRLNFTIRKGEFVSIIGPSGSGKSTLLNIIGALDKPTVGKVYIDGLDIFSLKDQEIAYMRNNLIGFIFQSFNLINRTTVQKNVEIPSTISGISSSIERNHRSLKLLGILGIKDKAKFKPPQLSGGQQQRVAIARALMNDPAIILADEPTGNLDTRTGNEVFGLLKMLSYKFGRTIIIVTHNSELAKQTNRSIYIRDGSIEKEIFN